MKEKDNVKNVIRLCVFIVALIAVVATGVGTGLFSSVENLFAEFHFDFSAILRLAVMVFLVLAITNLVLFILGLLHPKKHRARTVITLLSSAVKYISAIIMICWGLSILGADIGTIVAGIGILALVIGFGAESLIGDVVTGVFMLFENQYNVGDFLEVDGFRGKVCNIGIRTTCLEDAGGNVKVINNTAMKNILNRSNHPSRSVCTIGIPYETDLEKLEEQIPKLLEDIYAKHQDVLLTAPVYLGVEALADSAVVLKFVAEVEDKNIYSGARILNHDILLGFRQCGVEVPFPQLDVHQK